jgi:uncharacterized protein (TIGR02300 family)
LLSLGHILEKAFDSRRLVWQSTTLMLSLPCKGTKMPKEEWGTKRICPTTGKRFYDLKKTPIVSPYTGEIVDIETARRKLATNVAARVATEKAKATVNPSDGNDDLSVVDTPDETNLEDDLLEDDTDDTVSLDDLADVASPEEDV